MKKGAKFEGLVKESADLQNILCIRLKDGASRTEGKNIIRIKSSNVSDFIIYNGEKFLFLECKSYETSIPFSDLRQLNLMISEVEKYSYIKAGFIIQIKKTDNIYYISCQEVIKMMQNSKKKSFSESDLKNKVKTIMYPKKRNKRIDVNGLLEMTQ
jgi:penicillin-binding protein-related factor A (putative recombinase)